MKAKPLFNWVPPPDGRQRPARELLDHCVNIQKFYFMVERMSGEQVLAAYPNEVAALKEVAAGNGVQVLGPQWFARLFQ